MAFDMRVIGIHRVRGGATVVGDGLVDIQAVIYLDENDEMWISLRTGLPTLNGNSGWVPYGWRLEDHTIDYFDAARESIAATGLAQTVCLYNRSSRIWSRFGAPN